MASSASNIRDRLSAQEVLEMCVQNSNKARSDVDSHHEGIGTEG
jgi:hypothetical protein